MAVPVPLGTEDRTSRLTLRRPDRWRREDAPQADLRLTGDDVVLTVRSRPSERTIAEEHTSLLERLPGSVDGLRLIGCDPWTTAGAPARLVEYVRPDEEGDVAGAHLLFVTGRHRVDLTIERPLARMLATDDLVSAVLESVRATEPAPSRPQRELEALPVAVPVPQLDGTHLGADALRTLRSLAGRRWDPMLLRSPAGRELVQTGLVGRLGTLPEPTQELIAPWADDTQPVTWSSACPTDGPRASRPGRRPSWTGRTRRAAPSPGCRSSAWSRWRPGGSASARRGPSPSARGRSTRTCWPAGRVAPGPLPTCRRPSPRPTPGSPVLGGAVDGLVDPSAGTTDAGRRRARRGDRLRADRTHGGRGDGLPVRLPGQRVPVPRAGAAGLSS